MINYSPLWETMKIKGFTKYKLIHKHGISQQTISRMVKNMPTSTTTIEKLCKILECNVEDIITYVPDEEQQG